MEGEAAGKIRNSGSSALSVSTSEDRNDWVGGKTLSVTFAGAAEQMAES